MTGQVLKKQIVHRGKWSGKRREDPLHLARCQLPTLGESDRPGSGTFHRGIRSALAWVEQRVDDDLSYAKRAWNREARRLEDRAAKSTTLGSDLARPFAELAEEP
jgi:hypothetical protein